MVNKLINLIKKIKKEKGDIRLFMLLKSSPEITKWTVIISAKWLDYLTDKSSLDYWISQITKELNKNEIQTISRISVLKSNDLFVNVLTSNLSVTESNILLKNTSIGSFYIYEAIIIESNRSTVLRSTFAYNRNPNTNTTINPNYNTTINPNYNTTINPNYNTTINPLFNPNFKGYYLYDLQCVKIGYLINANERIVLLFNMNGNYTGVGIKSSNSFNIFDNQMRWIGFCISIAINGFNYFNTRSEWVGFIR